MNKKISIEKVDRGFILTIENLYQTGPAKFQKIFENPIELSVWVNREFLDIKMVSKK